MYILAYLNCLQNLNTELSISRNHIDNFKFTWWVSIQKYQYDNCCHIDFNITFVGCTMRMYFNTDELLSV